MANEGVEEVELTKPLTAVGEAGAEAELPAPNAGEIQAFDHLDKAETAAVDRPVGDADPAEFDGLVLPGGVAKPDNLRTHGGAVSFVRDFFAAGEPVGVICHGPWTPIEADASGKPDDLPAFDAKIVEEFAEGAHAGQAA